MSQMITIGYNRIKQIKQENKVCATEPDINEYEESYLKGSGKLNILNPLFKVCRIQLHLGKQTWQNLTE